MTKKQKLELTWIGKEMRPRLEPRILLEDPDKSYHADHRVSENDIFDNQLIFGDNLLALKALEQDYTGKVKCIYIDPPYNTGNAFEHYDDGLEHSIWLSLMRDRLEILRNLLSNDGVIFVQIDDNEAAYLKAMMDEVFGRQNYETTMFVQVRYGNKTLNEDNNYQKLIEQIFVYKKNDFRPNKEKTDYSIDKFCWEIEELTEGQKIKVGGRDVVVFKEGEYNIRETSPHLKGLKETWATGSLIKQGGSAAEFFDLHLSKRKNDDGLGTLYKVIDLGTKGDGLGYRYITGPKKETATKGKFYSGVPISKLEEIENGTAQKEKPIENFLDFAGSFGNCRLEGGVSFRGGKKPEALIQKLIDIGSNPGDIVLDSFAGSGTTGAVAHKMGRRWIMVELGEHCHTHIIPRMQKVIDGSDQGGISKTVDWKGGGGFRYYRVAPSLLQKDRWDNWVISDQYNAAMLTEAMCKMMGFTYAPSETLYWQHGHSTETDFIYVTTQTLDEAQLQALNDEVGEGNALLICCSAFRANPDHFPNLTLNKIPHAVLKKCEWGKDDYSLNVQDLPFAEEENDHDDLPLFDAEDVKAAKG